MTSIWWVCFVCSAAFAGDAPPVAPPAAPPPVIAAEPAPVAAPAVSAAPGTVARPISGRLVVVEAAEIERTANREWQKLTRSLLDVQNDLYEALNAEVRKFQATADGTSVKLVDGMRVEMRVLERAGETVSLKVRVLDANGLPITGTRGAYLTHGEGSEAAATREELVFAGAGEIVIEDLSTAEDAMVQIYLGDGDVLVLWLDEAVR